MAVRVLKYKLGSPNYGDSKLANWKIKITKTGFYSSNLVYGKWVFRMWQRMVSFSARTHDE